MYCMFCGTEIPDQSIFCFKCGKKLAVLPNNKKNISTDICNDDLIEEGEIVEVAASTDIEDGIEYRILGRNVLFNKNLFTVRQVRDTYDEFINSCVERLVDELENYINTDFESIHDISDLTCHLEQLHKKYESEIKGKAYQIVLDNNILDIDIDTFCLNVRSYSNEGLSNISQALQSIDHMSEKKQRQEDKWNNRLQFGGGGFGIGGAIRGAIDAKILNMGFGALSGLRIIFDEIVTDAKYVSDYKKLSDKDVMMRFLLSFATSSKNSWEGIINNSMLYVNSLKGECIYKLPYDEKGLFEESYEEREQRDKYERIYKNIDSGILTKEQAVDTYLEAITALPFFTDTYYRIILLDKGEKDIVFKLANDIGDGNCTPNSIIENLIYHEMDPEWDDFLDDDECFYFKEDEKNAEVLAKTVRRYKALKDKLSYLIKEYGLTDKETIDNLHFIYSDDNIGYPTLKFGLYYVVVEDKLEKTDKLDEAEKNCVIASEIEKYFENINIDKIDSSSKELRNIINKINELDPEHCVSEKLLEEIYNKYPDSQRYDEKSTDLYQLSFDYLNKLTRVKSDFPCNDPTKVSKSWEILKCVEVFWTSTKPDVYAAARNDVYCANIINSLNELDPEHLVIEPMIRKMTLVCPSVAESTTIMQKKAIQAIDSNFVIDTDFNVPDGDRVFIAGHNEYFNPSLVEEKRKSFNIPDDELFLIHISNEKKGATQFVFTEKTIYWTFDNPEYWKYDQTLHISSVAINKLQGVSLESQIGKAFLVFNAIDGTTSPQLCLGRIKNQVKLVNALNGYISSINENEGENITNAPDKIRCNSCGKLILKTNRFCNFCGQKV